MEEDKLNLSNENDDDSNKNNSRQNMKIIKFIGFVLVTIALVIAIINIKNYIYAADYRKALECITNNDYERAKLLLSKYSIDDYKDADDLYSFCKGCKKYEDGDLTSAYIYVRNLSFSYLDSSENDFVSEKIEKIKSEYNSESEAKKLERETATSTESKTTKRTTTKRYTTRRTTKKRTTTKKSDPYNAKKYSYEDDFYDDYYDDFFDFEDAEDYYSAHSND